MKIEKVKEKIYKIVERYKCPVCKKLHEIEGYAEACCKYSVVRYNIGDIIEYNVWSYEHQCDDVKYGVITNIIKVSNSFSLDSCRVVYIIHRKSVDCADVTGLRYSKSISRDRISQLYIKLKELRKNNRDVNFKIVLDTEEGDWYIDTNLKADHSE